MPDVFNTEKSESFVNLGMEKIVNYSSPTKNVQMLLYEILITV